MAVEFQGLDKVLRNLNKEIGKIKTGSLQGLINGGLFIKERAGQITPRDTSNLLGSSYVIWQGGRKTEGRFKGKDSGRMASDHSSILSQASGRVKNTDEEISVEIGYTAYYAVFVHEIDNNYRGGKQWKFLESSLVQEKAKLLQLIANEAQV